MNPAVQQKLNDRVHDFQVDALLQLSDLQNTYILKRHSHANSNVHGVLVSSDSSDALFGGLSPEGEEQAVRSAHDFLQQNLLSFLGEDIDIRTSPLSRCRVEAELLSLLAEQYLGNIPAITIEESLRERNWGAFEGEAVHRWAEILEYDEGQQQEAFPSFEQVHSFQSRLYGMISQYERENSGRTVVVISHCDVLQQFVSLFLPEGRGHYSVVKEFSHKGYLDLGEIVRRESV